MPRRCVFCGRDLACFDDGPCCIHQPPCALGFCFPCKRISYYGSCAKEFLCSLDLTHEVKDARPDEALDS